MMQQVRSLRERLKALRKQMLPIRFSRTGSYDICNYTSFAAYRFLVHAEFETYFESLALYTLDRIKDSIESGIPCIAAASILTGQTKDLPGAPSQISEIKDVSYLRRLQLNCIYAHKQKIERNNGIKTFNIFSMYIPLGLSECDIDVDFLIDLDTLAARRGDVAHRGISFIVTLPDPKDDLELVERILKKLPIFQRTLRSVY